jgi:hypothetical protein
VEDEVVASFNQRQAHIGDFPRGTAGGAEKGPDLVGGVAQCSQVRLNEQLQRFRLDGL